MIWPREYCQSDMLCSYSLNNFSMYNIENKQYTNTLQPSYREYFFDDLLQFTIYMVGSSYLSPILNLQTQNSSTILYLLVCVVSL